MSNNNIISIRKQEVEDFISIEHGTKFVTMTVFNGRIQAGAPGWAGVTELTPEQADVLGSELIARAEMVRIETKKGGS